MAELAGGDSATIYDTAFAPACDEEEAGGGDGDGDGDDDGYVYENQYKFQ